MPRLVKGANGEEFFELNKSEPGAVLSSKNHTGGLDESEDHSDGKIFPLASSRKCPVEVLKSRFLKLSKSGVSREISNSFIFCPYDLYSGVFSKITLKVSSACYFFRNRAKFEIRQISILSVTKLTENYPFSFRS